jgi:hypothetical protein
MSRFHRTIALSLLLTLLALPAFAVPSARAYQTSTGGFFSVLWSYLALLFSAETTDGRCTLDPGGTCTLFSRETTDGRCGLDPDGGCLPGGAASH